MVTVNGVGKYYKDASYHNGEMIMKHDMDISDQHNTIEIDYECDGDIARMLILKKWLEEKCPKATCTLKMLYCPYERMDREIEADDGNLIFSMRYFAQVIADAKFDKVVILDPHSQTCVKELVDAGVEVEVFDLKEYVNRVIDMCKPDCICYPDKGAHEKYTKVLQDIDLPVVVGSKKRDVNQLGRIVDYQLEDGADIKGKHILIVDDICCLGGTAYNAALQLKKAGAVEVNFYISHCENGIFVGKLLKPEEDGTYAVDRVFTAGTMVLEKGDSHLTTVFIDD